MLDIFHILLLAISVGLTHFLLLIPNLICDNLYHIYTADLKIKPIFALINYLGS